MVIQPEVLASCLRTDLRNAGRTLESALYPGISIPDAFAVSITNSLTKKFVSKKAADADVKARDKFLACNIACKNWSPRSHLWDTRIETLFGLLRQACYEFWWIDGLTSVCDHHNQILDEGRVGPGANIEARGGSSYAKLFSSKLSVSDLSLYNMYKHYIRSFPEWSIADQIREMHFGGASVMTSSRLSFVPKNDEISRCICTEPTLNTWFQLGFGRLLERRLRTRFGISLDRQPDRNRDLARFGSITDRLVTIDLSSASDSISMGMAEMVFPPELMRWLRKLRTPSVDIKGVGTIPLSMVSTMGNGFTFPLQTMLFACVVTACYKFRGITPRETAGVGEHWGVFGDDIICSRECARDVIDLLGFLGFTVNSDKTFVEGPFRESCGADFFKGVNIRGVYVKDTSTPASLYVAINQLTRFSARSGIYLKDTIGCLMDQIRQPLVVPPWEDMSAGVHYSQPPCGSWRKLEQQYTYQCLVAKPPRYRLMDDHIVVPSGAKRLIYNPSGLLMSVLLHEVNSSSIGFRTEHVKWVKKRRYTSNWFVPPRPEGIPYGDRNMDWRSWRSCVELYL